MGSDDLKQLSGKLDGGLVMPDDPGWDEARQAWNLVADQHPAAVALVSGADDVASVVAFAADNGLGVVAQGTGHGAGPLESLEGVVLIKTERLDGIEVDAGQRRARVGAGVLMRDMLDATQPAGLSALPGSSPDVGVVGFTLGGGLSWLGRRFGFACNSVHAIELVTADGEQRRVGADAEPELFWALRGGGGNFGVVTAIEVDLHPVAEVTPAA